MKRTELKRKTPLRAKTPARRRTVPRPKRVAAAATVERDAVRAAVFVRDGYRCRLDGVPGAGPCHGRLTFHHRRKASAGGSYDLANGATLCVFHNDQLEADADLAFIARTMGLVLRRGDEWGPREERFWIKVDRDGPVPSYRPDLGACWLWTAGATKEGYGCFHPTSASSVYAHRFALGTVEALVAGLEVDHLCRVKRCVNPRHLEQVDQAENKRRQQRAVAEARTTCRKGHPWANFYVSVHADGTVHRECRACARDRSVAARERKRAQR